MADYYALAPERVKVESYPGTTSPLPPPLPDEAKLTTAPAAELSSAPAHGDANLDDVGIFLKQLGPAGMAGAACAIFGIWFGSQLINENGRTRQATSDWILGFLIVVALIGIISSCLNLRRQWTSVTRPVALFSILANLLLAIGAIAAFVIFHSP